MREHIKRDAFVTNALVEPGRARASTEIYFVILSESKRVIITSLRLHFRFQCFLDSLYLFACLYKNLNFMP